MTPTQTAERTPAGMVPRNTARKNAEALFSLSQAQRRLAHRARREAEKAEAEGNLRWYVYWDGEARRLWKMAIWHLRWAREQFYL